MKNSRRLRGVSVLGVVTCTDCFTHAHRAVVNLIASLDSTCLYKLESEGVTRFRTRRIIARDPSLLAPGRSERCSLVSGGWWVNMQLSPSDVEKSLRRIAAALGWVWGRDIQLVFGVQ